MARAAGGQKNEYTGNRAGLVHLNECSNHLTEDPSVVKDLEASYGNIMRMNAA